MKIVHVDLVKKYTLRSNRDLPVASGYPVVSNRATMTGDVCPSWTTVVSDQCFNTEATISGCEGPVSFEVTYDGETRR